MAEMIPDPHPELEVLGEYDVVVAGGGPTGVCAGLSSARRGLKTLVIEQANCLGGIATAGLHQKIAVYFGSGGKPEIVGGIPKEIAERAVAEGGPEHRRADPLRARGLHRRREHDWRHGLDGVHILLVALQGRQRRLRPRHRKLTPWQPRDDIKAYKSIYELHYTY